MMMMMMVLMTNLKDVGAYQEMWQEAVEVV